VHVSEEACAALSRLLSRRSDAERCLRLSTVQGTYRFVLDEPIEQDVTFSHEGRIVLVVSETVSRDLWGITVDCAEERGKQKLIFRKAKAGEPLDTVKEEEEDTMPPGWKAREHEKLLEEIAEIGRQIASMRGKSRSSQREQLQVLEAAKQQKWDLIRTLWAGDGQWQRRNAMVNGNGAAPAQEPAEEPARKSTKKASTR
jgi:Fe-S cluster assembly iron-binding protein IscA